MESTVLSTLMGIGISVSAVAAGVLFVWATNTPKRSSNLNKMQQEPTTTDKTLDSSTPKAA